MPLVSTWPGEGAGSRPWCAEATLSLAVSVRVPRLGQKTEYVWAALLPLWLQAALLLAASGWVFPPATRTV